MAKTSHELLDTKWANEHQEALEHTFVSFTDAQIRLLARFTTVG
jgi:hypothetical protein